MTWTIVCRANRKTLEGAGHPDRNAQFGISTPPSRRRWRAASRRSRWTPRRRNWSATSRTAGGPGAPRGSPSTVRAHDFPDPAQGKAIPYGVYDLGRNLGWVSVGMDHDTAAFAVATIRRLVARPGAAEYPRATSLLITADGGGSNGARLRLWKWELQKLARDTGLAISVCHSHRGPASGTRSSIASSPSSPPTGEASRCATTRRSSISSPGHDNQGAESHLPTGSAQVLHRAQGEPG